MIKQDAAPVADIPRYNNWAFEPMVHQRFDHLKARLMNLAESSTRDRQQAEAMKGLMSDFLNTAYYPLLRDFEGFCREKGIIPKGEGQCGGAYASLTAKSISDIQVDPAEA